MNKRCCENHPDGCPFMAIFNLIGMVGVGVTFGWRWVFLSMLVSTEIDALVRLWQNARARREGAA